MELDTKLSCDDFPTDSSTSTKSGINFPCAPRPKPQTKEQIARETPPTCSNVLSTSSSSSTSISTGFGFNSECRLHKGDRKDPPNISYELAIAKSIMQQFSTLSGDNLFDHLSDIIKRVIDERPPNVIDFFEEFSRNVREQKFHLPERFPPDAIYEESRAYRVAKKLLLSMKLPVSEDHQDFDMPADEDIPEEESKSGRFDDLKLDIIGNAHLFITFNERVQQLQFLWNQCGFSISSDDIFQLACAMNRLQTHPSILQCRFWGVLNGLKASYYIVEASLIQAEINVRLEQMEEEMREKQIPRSPCEKPPHEKPLPSHIGPELTPGVYGWENYPVEDLAKMLPNAEPIPLIQTIEAFDIPPEPIGLGLNRYSYFVVNALSDDWIELPIVTPKQIAISRYIKKFLTGDLEAEINAYPCFPGKEKHYLRAMISRITAGTYIAPEQYYRKMTKREKRLYDGIEDDMEEEEEEEEPIAGEGEEEEEEIDNDIILLKNEKYEPKPLNAMGTPSNWVHVRPNILIQGRVVWYDVEKARKDRDKELARLCKLQMAEEMEEEEEEEDIDEDAEAEGEEELEELAQPEVGPPILHPCLYDASDEFIVPWIARYTSKYTNKNERVLVMQSNVWPGAYTFTFEKVCESIYMGWGHKYTSRNIAFKHLPPIVMEYLHEPEDFIETIDPSVEEEEAYRQWLLKKELRFDDGAEHLSEYDNETHESATDEDN